MTGVPDDEDVRRLVEKRSEFLAALTDGPYEKRVLVDRLDCSRSTVNRAIRELGDVGWVREREGGYETTHAGRLAVQAHRQYARTVDGLYRHADLLSAVPESVPLGASLLADATVERTEHTRAHQLIADLRTAIEEAESVRALVPSVLDPQVLISVAEGLSTRETATRASADTPPTRVYVDEALVEGASGRVAEALATLDEAGCLVVADRLPDLGCLVVERDGSRAVTVTVHDEQGALSGRFLSESIRVIQWAESLLESAAGHPPERLPPVPDEGSGVETDATDPVTATVAEREVLRDPAFAAAWRTHGPTLDTEGFEHLTPAYFRRRSTVAPSTALWTGLDFPEVAAGYAVDREVPTGGERTNLTETLCSRLAEGTDHAVVGPPGSGKSTICRSVAYRWYTAGRPVVYRESGGHRPFTSTGALAATLEAAGEHVLVVVEDAVRPEANAVFEVVSEFSDAADVTFLFDAREDDWEDGAEELDVRQEAYRQTEVRVRTVPALDEREIGRILDHVDDLVGDLPAYDPADLLDAVRDPGTGAVTEADGGVRDAGAAPGEVVLLFHRLARHFDAPGSDDVPTSLGEDVGRTYRDLRDGEAVPADVGLDVGVTINLLNAAGMEVTRDLCWTLGLRSDDYDVDAVAAAVDALSGRVVFEGAGPRLRTVHDTWSVAFLKRLLDDQGAAAAHRRVARCLTTVLELADDADLRDLVRGELQGETPAVETVAADPTGWADDTVERIFGVGQEHPSLAPLYGRTGHSRIDAGLPEACTRRIRQECVRWRATMYLRSGDFDIAVAEYEALADLAADVAADDPERATALRAASLERRSLVANRRGDLDEAMVLAEDALELFESIDDTNGEADCHNGIGVVAWLQGDLDRAGTALAAGRERYNEIEDRRGEANCVNNLGAIAWTRGDLSQAAEFFRESRDLREAVGDRAGLIDSQINLGVVARDAGEFRTAEERLRQALERARDFGGDEYVAHSKRALGNVLRRLGETGEAERLIDDALDRYRAMDSQFGEAQTLRALGALARVCGDLSTAERHAEDALAAYRECGDRKDEALALRDRGIVALERGDHADARADLTDALADLRAVGRQPGQAVAHVHLARLERATGDPGAAADHLESALDRYREIGADRYELAVLDRLVDLVDGTEPEDSAGESLASEDREDYRATRERLRESGVSPFPAEYHPF